MTTSNGHSFLQLEEREWCANTLEMILLKGQSISNRLK